MKIGPKYKIARRLGTPVFEKTQTQKYALSLQRKEKTARRSFSRPKSNFGIQLLEKQKARYTYCLSEKQFSKYAKNALERKDSQATKHFFESLESRLDNVVYRAGFAPTRLAARQMVSHGHITVDGRRVTIPSFAVKKGNVISIRTQSLSKLLFNDFEERMQSVQPPSWIAYDAKKKEATVQGVPVLEGTERMFDLNVILEFYSR